MSALSSIPSFCLLILAALISLPSLALVDQDNDGLVEIDSLEKLDAIRYQLDGAGLRLSEEAELDSSGCPTVDVDGVVTVKCHGYELTQDLDFDTNGNGRNDEGDQFWNEGKGWEPIALTYTKYGNDQYGYFQGVFEGNGFIISNFYIQYGRSRAGLFSGIKNSIIKNLVLSGNVKTHSGGLLVGRAEGSSISKVFVAGHASFTASWESSLIVGRLAERSYLTDSVASGSFYGGTHTGTLVGSIVNSESVSQEEYVAIENSYSTAKVIKLEDSRARSLLGWKSESDFAKVENTFWAKDLVIGANSLGANAEANYVGLNSSVLKCPLAANADHGSGCVSANGSGEDLDSAVVLYKGWDDATWGFGNDQQLPGLKLNGRVFRDSDNDGAIDMHDKWPDDHAAAYDSDNDGYIDRWERNCSDECRADSSFVFDHFPNHENFWLDADFDGMPDGEVNCTTDCEADGLIKDPFLNDFDNDGILDSVDDDGNNDDVLDVDSDHDGLIEVSSLAEFDAIRNEPYGKSQRLENRGASVKTGCPFKVVEGVYQRECHGYELTQDLNFDTNANGEIDIGDDYWNADSSGAGLGWDPIRRFKGVFNGNGFSIQNLFINRPQGYYVGLFAQLRNAQIENLAITGPLNRVVSGQYGGMLAGNSDRTNIIRNVFIAANIRGEKYIGGLLGWASAEIDNVVVTGVVQSDETAGGIVGITGGYHIADSYNLAKVSGIKGQSGGVCGQASTNDRNSYWAKDFVNLDFDRCASEHKGIIGVSLSQLQCATAANADASTGCVSVDGSGEGLANPMVLYKDWDESVWDFGTTQQVPGIKMGGRIYRDNDGDGVLDSNDDLPNNSAAFIDSDGDGFPDSWVSGCDVTCIANAGVELDKFPHHAGAWQDQDNDGRPDAANPACSVNCSLAGLWLDDNAMMADSDGDGISNELDDDDNDDGQIDIDADSDGLVDIDSLAKLNAIRYQLSGAGLQLSDDSELDVSGCPFMVHEGVYQQRCVGYELLQDLDFDSNGDSVISIDDEFSNLNYDGEPAGWQPIASASAPFTAVLNGNNFHIKNLYINRPHEDLIGFFRVLNGAHISNLHFSGPLSKVVGDDYVAALAVRVLAKSQIRSVTNLIPITGASSVAGIVSVLKSHSNVHLLANHGAVTGSGYNASGGVVALSEDGTITSSYNTGTVSGTTAGGVAGQIKDTTMQGVFNTGDVSSTSASGGVIGVVGSYHNMITAAFNTGNVSGMSAVGGIAGRHYGERIVASFSTGVVSGTDDVGGFVGRPHANYISSSFWATDASQQQTGSGEDAARLYWGLPLATLKCATSANSTSGNSGCVSDNGSLEGADQAITLYKDWQQQTYINSLDQEVAYWDFGDNDQLPGLNINGTVFRDSDGDGLLDDDDFYSRISLGGRIDTDNDGIPDDCNAECIAAGMEADPDNDDDGILDESDGYPEVAITGFADIDSDGRPDECAQDCLDLGMSEDEDDDGDGVPDTEDAFSKIPVAEADDRDRDGRPDECDMACQALGMDADEDDDDDGVLDDDDEYRFLPVEVANDSDRDGIPTECNQACKDLGMVADDDNDNDKVKNPEDDFEFIYAASVDADEDGLPDAWTEECNTQCRADSGLTLDVHLNDTDNDGAENDKDAFVDIYAASVDADEDGLPDAWTEECNTQCRADSGLSIDLHLNDSDNDGAENDKDAFVDIYAASVDADEDGLPDAWTDNCNEQCRIDSGLTLDVYTNDFDNDGAENGNDAFENIYAASVDADEDGLPDAWTENCNEQCRIDSGLTLDVHINDSDNDGAENDKDAFVDIYAASVDADEDGLPDAWTEECNTQCRSDSGLSIDLHLNDSDNDGAENGNDAFVDIYAASVDVDEDGLPDAWTDNCNEQCRIDSGLTLDVHLNDTDNDGAENDKDAFVDIYAASIDADEDGLPDAWTEECRTQCRADSGLTLDEHLNDTDNDGAENDKDAFVDIYAASVDADEDGLPDAWTDNCDEQCRTDSGLTLDLLLNDTDNDGVNNDIDGFKNISIADLADFDKDGRPDVCDTACLALGMTADDDNDNDGVLNVVDAFEFNADASLDADNDGLLDEWNEGCLLDCQNNSALVKDNYPNDTDNDGVTNDLDQNSEQDNGKPLLTQAPPARFLAVNNLSGSAANITEEEVDQMFAFLRAEDAIDSFDQLSFKAFLNGNELTRNADGGVVLSSGLQVISWAAVDRAGNQSDIMEQKLYIYPRLKFSQSESIIGEASDAEMMVELTGESPYYPLTITFDIDQSSSVDQADINNSFDLSLSHTVILQQGIEDDALNTQAKLIIPVLEDNLVEDDEQLLINITKITHVYDNDDTQGHFVIEEDNDQHQLTVTYQNLAPTVQLLVQQGGVEVANIKQQGGDVTIKAVISDGNGSDTHSLVWDINSLNLNAPLGDTLTFSPDNLTAGNYDISVTATDSGLNPLEASATVNLKIVVPVVEPAGPETDGPDDQAPTSGGSDGSSGGSGGGSLELSLMLLLIMLVAINRRRLAWQD